MNRNYVDKNESRLSNNGWTGGMGEASRFARSDELCS